MQHGAADPAWGPPLKCHSTRERMSAESGTASSALARVHASSLRRYLHTLWEHAWLIALCVVVCVGATAIYVATTPHKYRATADMLISPVSANTTTLIGLPVLFSSGDPTRDVLTASSLITTPQVAEVAARMLADGSSADALLGSVTATPV